jgi:maleylacetoacetate isomerase
MGVPRLYTYFRSGAAQRVRIGLALKGVAYDSVPVHLVRNGGEHLLPGFKVLNPEARVPVLELSDGTPLAQSSAILEYLDETIGEPPFLPADPTGRAKVRRIAESTRRRVSG